MNARDTVPREDGARLTGEVALIASNAVREPFGELLPVFERATGSRVSVSFGGTLDIVSRVESGEIADIVVIPAARVDDLVKAGRLARRTDLVRSRIGIAAGAGVPRPDVSSAAALRSALVAARSVVLSSGPSSNYMPVLFERMGIATDIARRIIKVAPGVGVGATLARGVGEIGFTQISELMSVEGIQYLGPLPAEVQFVTVFSAGLHAAARVPDRARALLTFLASPPAGQVLERHGLEPAGAED